ncbi:MAG: winged helix-turn-helix transcriptional regulator [Chloroflexota bacterium]|nr:winged helix-turn-helix transcriptional regulator [Chloroflexota bacterium]
MIVRRIYARVPPKVDYALITLGRTLVELVQGIRLWAESNIEEIQDAQRTYDERPAGVESDA